MDNNQPLSSKQPPPKKTTEQIKPYKLTEKANKITGWTEQVAFVALVKM